MKSKSFAAIAAVGAGSVGLLATTALPAQALDQRGFANNGCTFNVMGGNDFNGSNSGAGAQIWGDGGCDAGWMELHYRDSKGNQHSLSDSSSWGTYGGSNVATSGSNTTFDYVCFRARSRSVGNWSVTRCLS